ncbi:hypothetical protein CMUS01_14533 [Colletotrichum musicola]|uniref:Uncharacterized protein n=1 Tax=Colletotrichum musicola TaxID=2175873 RepID=A0A8H6MRN6_9PEZI|nr:hypothetical protein CMUS01_14533 [Colletotrichum musicola]
MTPIESHETAQLATTVDERHVRGLPTVRGPPTSPVLRVIFLFWREFYPPRLRRSRRTWPQSPAVHAHWLHGQAATLSGRESRSVEPALRDTRPDNAPSTYRRDT